MNSLTANASQSLGPASQLFMALIQSLVASEASVSPEQMWPENRGPHEKGIFLTRMYIYLFTNEKMKYPSIVAGTLSK